MSSIKPLGDRVLVEVFIPENKTEGGIIIPDNAEKEKTEGKVVSVGPRKNLDSGISLAVGLKVGDKVIFGKYSGDDLLIDGKKHKIIREDDIIAIYAN